MTVLGRDAVVIIHGIGEQVPLETVRGFVGRTTARAKGPHPDVGVAADADRVFSEPSPVGGRTDDRAYVVTWNHAAATEAITGQPDPWPTEQRSAVTDFYEFYWAPHYRSTTFGQLSGWLVPLLLRPLSTFQSPRLVGTRGLVRWTPPLLFALAFAAAVVSQSVGLSWVVGITAVAVLMLAGIFVGTTLGLVGTFHVLALATVVWTVCCVTVFGFADAKSIAQAVGSSVVVAVALRWLGVRITRVLGDAARYLSSTPDSVEENDLIRQQVLLLLERLHDVRDPDTLRMRYDRIVVVGHSLGSVIAYDAVRLLWARRYRTIALPPVDDITPAGQAISHVEEAGTALADLALGPDCDEASLAAARAEFTSAQRDLQLLMRDPVFDAGRRDDRDTRGDDAPPRWIVTDLITLGSPLAYADAFMAHNLDELRDRFEDRSLVRNPPVAQQVREAAGHPYRLRTPDYDEVQGTTRFHHAAPFACVEWTNLYFDHDIVGGPLAIHFGPGIKDQSLGGSRWLGAFAFAYPHSSYWMASKRHLLQAGSIESLRVLRSKIQRPPVLLMTAPAQLDAAHAEAVGDVLAGATTSAAPTVQVRLYVSAPGALPQGAYLPVGRIPLPPHTVIADLLGLLGDGAEIALLSNPDPLAGPEPLAPGIGPIGRTSDVVGRDPYEHDTIGEEAEPPGGTDPVGEEE